jgi:hypothetical protein
MSRLNRFVAALPMRGALAAVAVVWVLGCVWSYREQSAFAAAKGFEFPHLLPLVIDGFAAAMAGVAWAASLDARAAIPARLATLVAVLGSSASNGTWAWERTSHDLTAVVLAVAVPVGANLAFEVLLAELRRQVQRGRGLPPPVAVPYPRLIRLALAPWPTFRDWRRLVLDLTAPQAAEPELRPGVATAIAHRESAGDDRENGTEVPATNGHDRAAELIAAGAGRRRVAKELDISEHQARRLLAHRGNGVTR